MTGKRWSLVGAGVVLVLAVALGGRILWVRAHDPEDAAIAACRDYVSDNLKSPSSAKFSRESVERNLDDASTWTASGAVDSENALGVSIRTVFVCKVLEGAGGDMTVEDAKFG